jgi:type 2 lantibiotic biosynthesis protein LanM
MHFENLIASGEHPILVDLEALFQPRLAADEAGSAQALARQALSDSVLRVSLLPQRVWRASNEGYSGIDISGIEARPGQLNAERTLSWEEEGADTMRVVRRRELFEGGKNRPTLEGAEGSALEHTEELIEGFTGMYRLLMRHREELLAEDGPLACFAQDQTRVLIRHTAFYAKLLEESFHPDVLRDALDRDQLFDRLWRGIERAPFLSRVIASEHEDLWAGDVPCFTARPASRDLWDSAGRRIEGFLSESGLETVRRGVARMSEEELSRQRWFIRASLCSLAPQHSAQVGPSSHVEPPRPPSREALISAAEAIAKRLDELSLRGRDDATWLGLTPALSVEPLGLDLYDGVPGVALFLASLEALTGKEQYGELGRAAWMNVRRQLESHQSPRLFVGAWTGLGGLLYTASQLRILWNEPGMEAEAERLLETLAGLIDEEAELDLMGGSAGCILVLGVLRQAMPGLAARALALAVRCGERLLSHARKLAVGTGWGNPSLAPQPLSGFAHGAAGFALALLELAAATGDSRFREAALEALAYERSLFSREAGNWRDLREPRESFCMAWCHGAPGIGLSRLCALDFLDDEALRAEISAALETTCARGFGMNHSLCHGDLGNLELLVTAGQVLEDGERWRQQASLRAGAILRSMQGSGWQCGTLSRVEVPGLMTGLAGIGYGLLRLVEPLRVPSVLALKPPYETAPSTELASRSSRSASYRSLGEKLIPKPKPPPAMLSEARGGE